MEVNIVLAYDSVDEVCRLFSEYTDMLINGDPEFREYLEIQNYDEELNHLDTKYGLPGGRLYLAYCDGRAAGCIGLKKLDVDKDNERIIKEYIDGDTVYEMVLEDRLPATCLEQVRAMCGPLYAANINIDYFPTNFILQDGALYYVDYECNEYMEEWNFETWGVKYWSKTPEFLKYAEEHLHISNLKNWPRLSGRAAQWFHEKWQIPLEEYRSSIEASISGGTPVPQWYVAVKGERIIGGLGVIENDFHRRKDLTPNVCALYVEEECRGQGIAGKLLDHVCRDMLEKGIDTLYLITDHTSFYERYGWEFLCLVEEEEGGLCRMYVHRENGRK